MPNGVLTVCLFLLFEIFLFYFYNFRLFLYVNIINIYIFKNSILVFFQTKNTLKIKYPIKYVKIY